MARTIPNQTEGNTTMQASKIKPHEIYAIKQNDRLVRFCVSAVITRRINNHGNPHDYESTVEGFIPAPDNGGKPSDTMTLDPTLLLGPYKEHVELVAREEAEKAERDRITAAKEEKRERLVAALYEATGLERPAEERRYSSTPFHPSYSGVDISAEAIDPLLKFLEGVKQSA
jgi:hypothetical protein